MRVTLTTLLSRLRRAEGGFTMVAVLGVMLIGSAFAVAAFGAVTNDTRPARADQDYKEAYAAAEAGLNYYKFQLNQDNGYWAKCTSVPPPSATEPSPVNQVWSGSGADPRQWRKLPGSTAAYTIELLPAAGYSQCSTSVQASMLSSNGTFRIRVTGRATDTARRRSLIATFKRASFLDYLYFTKYETADPVTYGSSSWIAAASQPTPQGCVGYRSARPSWCSTIQFASSDVVSGPLHTNDDSILTCGTPTFGRNGNDLIEVAGPDPGWISNGCSGSPDFQGTLRTTADGVTRLEMPPYNTALQQAASPSYVFTGTTRITLNGNGYMSVTNPSWSGTKTLAVPTNPGIIYVKDGSCGSSGYDAQQDYTTPSGCGDVWIKGTATSDLTIASSNDTIIDGNLLTNSNAVVGIIANNFIRIYHPVSRGDHSCSNSSGTMSNVEIDAALLALNHSFIVDNYDCGWALGTLTVKGAIAQQFRGPVGTGGWYSSTGYSKDYQYDDRLHYREPPAFLDPVQATWDLARQTEQVPAR